jgi:CubicO group peptidase (beta-lactamase class C family)
MNSTTFYPRARPDILQRTASLVERDQSGKLQALHPNHPFVKAPAGIYPESGGGGLYGTANDYIKLLTSFLQNDGKVLKPETVKMMFSPQLKDPIHLRRFHSRPLLYGFAGHVLEEIPVDFGFGGIMNAYDVSLTCRSKGSMQWGGLPNLFWWINPQDGVCGCCWGQLLPTGDPQSFKLYIDFEKAVMDSLREKEDGRSRL